MLAVHRGVVLDSVFPGWSNPLGIAALVTARFVVNCSVSGLAARTFRSSVAALAVAGAVLSLLLMIGVLRPGLLGIRASYLEAAVQLGLVLLAVTTAVVSDSRGFTVAAAALALLGLGLLAVSLPIYGEATVAP